MPSSVPLGRAGRATRLVARRRRPVPTVGDLRRRSNPLRRAASPPIRDDSHAHVRVQHAPRSSRPAVQAGLRAERAGPAPDDAQRAASTGARAGHRSRRADGGDFLLAHTLKPPLVAPGAPPTLDADLCRRSRLRLARPPRAHVSAAADAAAGHRAPAAPAGDRGRARTWSLRAELRASIRAVRRVHVVRSRAYAFVLDARGLPIEIGQRALRQGVPGEERWLESKTDFRRPVVIKNPPEGRRRRGSPPLPDGEGAPRARAGAPEHRRPLRLGRERRSRVRARRPSATRWRTTSWCSSASTCRSRSASRAPARATKQRRPARATTCASGSSACSTT